MTNHILGGDDMPVRHVRNCTQIVGSRRQVANRAYLVNTTGLAALE